MRGCFEEVWHIGPQTGFLVGVAIGVIMLSLWASRLREFPGRVAFINTHIGMLWWLVMAALELAAPTFGCKMLIARLTWPGVMVVAIFWCVFLNQLAIVSHARLSLRRIWPLLIVIMIGGGLAFTNPWHGWLYGPGTHLGEQVPSAQIVFDHGPLFFALVIVLYVFLGFGILIVVRALLVSAEDRRGRLWTCLALTLFPIMVNLSYVLGGITLFGFDPTPFSFVVTLTGFTCLITNSFDGADGEIGQN